MASPTFTLSFVGTPSFYNGTAQTEVVPSVYPVAINGRPYLIDTKSGKYVRSHEPRVRDSTDDSTSPGEAAINPGGLWRRGQDSWHYGAGQQYSDTAEAQDYRFYKSKGINPWVKGQFSLHHATKRSLESASTNLFMCTVKASNGTEYVYVADNATVKYSTDPFAATPTWTSVTTGSPGTAITGLETNGTNVFVGYTSNDIYSTTPGSASVAIFYPASGSSGKTYTGFGYAKGWGFASVLHNLYVIGTKTGQAHKVFYPDTGTAEDTTLRWVGAAAGQGAVYLGAYSGTHSSIYKLVLKTDATGFDLPVVALELPVGEVVSSVYGYLGGILVGTNKGVRYCTADANNNLLAGALIPTSGSVNDFIAEDKYVWFTWSNYDGTSSGLGRLDLSVYIAPNTPAFATDLMYTSTAAVKSVTTFDGKRLFAISGVGVIAEDVAAFVSTGNIEFGIYRWGIPDRKFVAKMDVRTEPLKGTVEAFLQNDQSDYASLGTFNATSDIEYTYNGSDVKTIEAGFKLVLTPTDNVSPIVTRWMARAYAAPFRSEVFSIPCLLHQKIRPRDRDIYMDPEQELDTLNSLIHSPKIVTLQLGTRSYSVIVEDVEWVPVDSTGNTWSWDGTATVTMRSTEN